MKRAPKKVRSFRFLRNKDIEYSSGITAVKGLGAAVYSILWNTPNTVWNSRELAAAIEDHESFVGSKQDPKRVANTWIFKLRKMGLIVNA